MLVKRWGTTGVCHAMADALFVIPVRGLLWRNMSFTTRYNCPGFEGSRFRSMSGIEWDAQNTIFSETLESILFAIINQSSIRWEEPPTHRWHKKQTLEKQSKSIKTVSPIGIIRPSWHQPIWLNKFDLRLYTTVIHS